MELLLNPKNYFEKLRDKKISITLPLIIILITGILSGVDAVLAAEGISLKEVLSGNFPIGKFLFLVFLSDITFYLLILAQTFLFTLIIKKLGGTGGGYKHSFYVLGMTTIPILIQTILHLVFPGTIWWNQFYHLPIIYYLCYVMLNGFAIWSVSLLIIGFAKVYQVSYKKAFILYAQFLIKIIPLVIIKLLI